MKRLVLASSLALALAACNDQYASNGKSLQPIPRATTALMAEKGMSKSDPILVRVYKKEAELELWKKGLDGEYAMLKTFPICRWSGQLGPKRREGDRQTPEGFYTITPGQMNPNSSYYLSFDTGYPNAYDKAHGGTGSYLMVHGSCSSRGCYAMTDEGISEVYALAREAFAGGQKGFQFQAYPFRMTPQNLARYRNDPNMAFWRNLKEGSDTFEITGREPKVAVCGGRYAFNTVGNNCTADPTLAPALAQKDENDRRDVAELVAKGAPSVRLVYADGGQHESFRNTALAVLGADAGQNFSILDTRPRRNLGDVSRPDALAQGPSEIPVGDAPIRAGATRKTQLAAAEPAAPRKPDPSKPARTVLASADPDDGPIVTASAAAARPSSFYDRMIGSVFGPSATPEAVRAASPPSAASNAATSLPPPRAATAKPAALALPPAKPMGRPQAAAPTAPKPQAALPPSARQVIAGAFIPGAQPVGPTAAGFRQN